MTQLSFGLDPTTRPAAARGVDVGLSEEERGGDRLLQRWFPEFREEPKKG
jgi:hypothetical protein